jgi:hypothetical protein
MDERDTDVARQATRLHEETPHAVRVSVTLSNDTRELLSEIRDDLNDRAGESILNTNDVVRLALRGAASYHETAPETDDIRVLTAAVHDAMDGREDAD